MEMNLGKVDSGGDVVIDVVVRLCGSTLGLNWALKLDQIPQPGDGNGRFLRF